ncbi:MAG: hypothetical protein CVU77_04180, partial [Elusimicrobia bacterium HGW-Elusimicrobia-1]
MWLGGWKYRRKITINNSLAYGLSDYQVWIPTSAFGSQWSAIRSSAQPTMADFRFTPSTATTTIPYWIDYDTTTANCRGFWVKVSTIPAGSNTIYMYYGNATASVGQSGVNAFVFFDDFNDGDVSDWSKESSSIASGVIDGCMGINITIGGSSYKDVEVYKTVTLPLQYIVESMIKDIGGGEYPGGLLINFQDINNWLGLEGATGGTPQWTERGENGGVDTGWINTYTPNIIPTGWARQRIDIPNNGNYTVWIDNINKATKAIPYAFSRNAVGFCKHTGYNNIFSDWIFVRKYAPTEPTISSVAAEEGAFFSTGTYRSAVIDAASKVVVSSVSWNPASQPAGTNISVGIRISSYPFSIDSSTPAWLTVSNG